MTDPEIQLPMTSSQLYLDDRAPGISSSAPKAEQPRRVCNDPAFMASTNFDEKFIEKSDNEDIQEDGDQEDTEIVYHYLTFSTELPSPTSVYPTTDGQEAAPEPPDLKNYESPFDWPDRRKRYIIWVACVITALTAFTAGAYTPGVGQMTQEWHVSNVAALVGVTTFTTGEYTFPHRLCHSFSCPVESPCRARDQPLIVV